MESLMHTYPILKALTNPTCFLIFKIMTVFNNQKAKVILLSLILEEIEPLAQIRVTCLTMNSKSESLFKTKLEHL